MLMIVFACPEDVQLPWKPIVNICDRVYFPWVIFSWVWKRIGNVGGYVWQLLNYWMCGNYWICGNNFLGVFVKLRMNGGPLKEEKLTN